METTEQLRIAKIVEIQGVAGLASAKALKEYDVLQHEIFDKSIRPDKRLELPNGFLDEKGEELTSTTIEPVNRIAIPLQKLIVARRVAFMNVGAMTVKCNPLNDKQTNLLRMVEKCLEDNKMKFKAKDIARRMMSELQVAELWYSEPAEQGYWGDLAPKGVAKMRMKILSPQLGDELLPVFNSNGDLVYFGRKYKTTIDFTSPQAVDLEIKQGKDIERFDIYTSEKVMQFVKLKSGWALESQTAYAYGKMPIIYYWQPTPEWADVQTAISRIETTISNLGDVVDYNGSPILVANGEIKGFSKKGERGKVLELELGASVNYVSWDAAPESIKLEMNTLIDFVYTFTQTPNITPEGMKGLGAISGTACDRIFMDAHLAAQSKLDGLFGECLQRQLNFLKSACIAINSELKSEQSLQMTPDVPLYRINDETETINKLITATAGMPILSQKTAVAKLGFTDDAELEVKQLQNEAPKLPQPPTI